jgi:PAS fold
MAIHHQHNDDHMPDLILTLHPQLRRRLTRAAAQSHLSLEEYVGRILEQVVPPETIDAQDRSGRLDRRAVEDLKEYREEIRRTHPGQVFEDSVELLRQAREERTRELEQR